MDRLWQVGLFAKDDSYYDDIFNFTNKLIQEKCEEIKEIIKCNNKFEIRTNKSIYKFVVVNENIRGYRWHEAYVFDTWLIDLDKINSLILAKIVRYDVWDKDTDWNPNDYVHYNPMNKSRFITWTRWFQNNKYDISEAVYNTHSEYNILEFEKYCVADKRYIIPTRELFLELLDGVYNKEFKYKSYKDKYIKDFIINNKLKEERIR